MAPFTYLKPMRGGGMAPFTCNVEKIGDYDTMMTRANRNSKLDQDLDKVAIDWRSAG